MSFARAISLIISLSFAIAALSCVEDKDYGEAGNLRPDINRNVQVNENDNVAEDSEIKLDALVNLPIEPEESVFNEEPILNANTSNSNSESVGKRLKVVLRYSEEDAAKLVRRLAKENPPFETEVAAESWFPAELKAKSETSGNQQLKGKGYSAVDFAKAPWLNGSVIRIEETNYFVLILQTNPST